MSVTCGQVTIEPSDGNGGNGGNGNGNGGNGGDGFFGLSQRQLLLGAGLAGLGVGLVAVTQDDGGRRPARRPPRPARTPRGSGTSRSGNER